MKIKKIQKTFNFIIFGASGDLANIKLFPAICALYHQKRFSKQFTICGYARTKYTDESFRKHVKKSILKYCENKISEIDLDRFLKHVYYQSGEYDQTEGYKKLSDKLLAINKGGKVKNMAYFAIPPSVYQTVIEHFSGMKKWIGRSCEVILEKPFGNSEKSATELFHFISRFFKQHEVFLLDHYLGKSPVQSILPLRYSNAILNLLLKGRDIKNIQISALESVGVENRIGFFESVGIVKDMIQSHLLQVLTLFTMALPYRQNSENIKREKQHILSALQHANDHCGVVLGQYKSYKKQKGVAKDSKTPTFAAIRLFVDWMDWYKVPIYIRAGKKLNRKHTTMVVEFRKPPFYRKEDNIDLNRLIIEMYPEEKIQIKLVNAKGNVMPSESIAAESLACSGEGCLPDYGRLILDAFLGDQSYFLSFPEILASWRVVDRLAICTNKSKIPIYQYKDKSEGPKAQHQLTKIDDNEWYDMDY